ncbi:hypothetical protein AB0I60_31765 [Actinosynnema sp. NPDC050436]|uniref:hypothetical protein n=1 Tax=Actinosynnema sp. NPDC050436 TaxID=3155659 RepID=UPI0033FB8896
MDWSAPIRSWVAVVKRLAPASCTQVPGSPDVSALKPCRTLDICLASLIRTQLRATTPLRTWLSWRPGTGDTRVRRCKMWG